METPKRSGNSYKQSQSVSFQEQQQQQTCSNRNEIKNPFVWNDEADHGDAWIPSLSASSLDCHRGNANDVDKDDDDGGNDNDHDDDSNDDDEVLVRSSEYGSDEEEDKRDTPRSRVCTYMEKRNANIQRNQERLAALGFGYNHAVDSGDDGGSDGGDGVSNDGVVANGGIGGSKATVKKSLSSHGYGVGAVGGGDHVQQKGMLFPTEYNQNWIKDLSPDINVDVDSDADVDVDVCRTQDENLSISKLVKEFPHRRKEIVLLCGLLKNAVRQSVISWDMEECGYDGCHYWNGCSFSPPPIFVHGPSGTGKSTIVRKIVQEIQKDVVKEKNKKKKNEKNEKEKVYDVCVGTAYVNCATMEPYGSGATAILQSLHGQLEQDFCRIQGKEFHGGIGNDMDRKSVGSERDKNRDILVEEDENLDASSLPLDLEVEVDDYDSQSRLYNCDADADGDGGDSIHESDTVTCVDLNNSEVETVDVIADTDIDINVDIDADADADADVDEYGEEDEEDVIEQCAAKERRGYFKNEDDLKFFKQSRPSISSRKRPEKKRKRQSSRLNYNTSRDIMTSQQGNGRTRIHTSTGTSTRSAGNVLTTPVAFGRSIVPFCGASKYSCAPTRGCAIVVLDHADELLSFSHNKQKDNFHTNFLSELLLLPQHMNLNLTIIAITNKLMLEHSRMSNIDMPSNVFGTIQAAVCPIMCHFQGYETEEMLRDIMLTPRLMKLVVGKGGKTSIYIRDPSILKLYRSLVDIVIQSVESSTRHIGEILRLVRMLWPLYLSPLKKIMNHNHNSASTTQDATTSLNCSPVITVDRELLEQLGTHVRPYLRQVLTKCLLRPFQTLTASSNTLPSRTSSNVDGITASTTLPYFSKFLLLAAYLCQTNRADKDRLLYTNQRAGSKRRRKTNKSNSSMSDSLTYATSQSAHSERLPSFPLERMLSVFSSICNKYATSSEDVGHKNGGTCSVPSDMIDVALLGNVSLMRSLLELRQCGLLEEATSYGIDWNNENLAYSKSMSSTKFICRLSRQEADVIAKSLHFPLEGYLMRK